MALRGEAFLNLLSLRGLVVARDTTGQEIWVLLAVQQDVTGLRSEALPCNDAVLSKAAEDSFFLS